MTRAILIGMLALLAVPPAAAGEALPATPAHPWILHQAGDRERIAATNAEALARRIQGIRHDRLKPAFAWEDGRSEALYDLAVTAWLSGGADLRAELAAAAAGITLPDGRRGDVITGPGDRKGWGRILEASQSLSNYALAGDYLEGAAAETCYERVADGIFHLLVEHLRSWDWSGQGAKGNNWNGRELAAVGLACLAFLDRFAAEPEGSRRRRDCVDGLELVRRYAPMFLRWAEGGDRDRAYYYEGPHYLAYWSEMFLVFAAAHERIYPRTRADFPALGLAPGGPLSRFLRAHAMTVMPVAREQDGSARWSNAPFDDTWTYAADATGPLALAAALMPEDAVVFRGALAACGVDGGHRLRFGLAPAAGPVPAPLPRVDALRRDGIAVVRSGPLAADLHVALKNGRTFVDGDGAPQAGGHQHSDNGSVLAYRDGEPVLIDPAYGKGGFANPEHQRIFCNWNRHNLLLVEDAAGYAPALRQLVGDPEPFVLPLWPADARTDRISRAEVVDGLGAVAEAASPVHHRLVAVVDRGLLLVVDRLAEARRLRLCWFGNGVLRPAEPTAAFDPALLSARYAGARLATRIRVLMPVAATLRTVPSLYGRDWGTDEPITGMWVTSAQPAAWAVTVVETTPRDGAFGPEATVREEGGELVIAAGGRDVRVPVR